jgi:hypothetical protein
VAEIGGPLVNGKILIDLLDAKRKVETADVDNFFCRLSSNGLSHGGKVYVAAAWLVEIV